MALTAEQEQLLLDCLNGLFTDFNPELEGCDIEDLWQVDKQDLVDAIQTYLAENPNGPTPQTFEGELVGSVIYSDYRPADFGTPVPTLDAPALNPACGPNAVTMFVNPNIPAGCNGESFDFTYTVLDATAGMGNVYAVEKSTGTQIPGQGYAPGTGGPNQGPVPLDHTITFGPIPAGVDCTDICIMFDAYGAISSAWGCDEIDPTPSALITVLPSPCAAAADCFEAIFGCTLGEMLNSDTTPGGVGDTLSQLSSRPYVCASGFVTADGELSATSCGFELEKTGDGEYELTFAQDIIALQLTAEKAPAGSETIITYEDLGGSWRVETQYGDNGGAADISRDNGFSVTAYCKDSI